MKHLNSVPRDYSSIRRRGSVEIDVLYFHFSLSPLCLSLSVVRSPNLLSYLIAVNYNQSEETLRRLRSLVHYQTTTQSLSRPDLEVCASVLPRLMLTRTHLIHALIFLSKNKNEFYRRVFHLEFLSIICAKSSCTTITST